MLKNMDSPKQMNCIVFIPLNNMPRKIALKGESNIITGKSSRLVFKMTVK